jgi:hypothetical protein
MNASSSLARPLRAAVSTFNGGFVKSILDPTFRYRSSFDTDLKTTFAKIRREQRKKRQSDRAHATGNLTVLRIASPNTTRR